MKNFAILFRIISLVLAIISICGCAGAPVHTPMPSVSNTTSSIPADPTPTPVPKITVNTFEELTALTIGTNSSIKSGDIIYIESEIEITEAVQFSFPVSFHISAQLICTAPITVKTTASESVSVYISDGISYENIDIRYDTPNCNLFWEGVSAPSELTASEIMNVRSYNGIDIRGKYTLGGFGTDEILTFSLRPEENQNLTSPLNYIVKGNTIELSVSYLISDTVLEKAVAYIESNNNILQQEFDLTKDQLYTLKDTTGAERTYKIKTNRITYNLPVFYIEIEDDAEVTSREEYLNATVRVDTSTAEGNFPDLETTDILIRGRGHYSWNFDKKPYKIRFDKKTSVLGMNASKNWVLVSNYVDRSLIQNYIAREMSKMLENIQYNTTQYPVDVFVNGTYRGVYTFGEQIEGKPERMNLEENYEDPDTDYLLEIGGSDDGDVYGQDYFHAGTIKFAAIKHPDSSLLTDEQISFLRDYVAKADTAVKNLDGYENYIDVDSLIDWVIIHEISYNLDCCFRRSCYIIKEKGEKLKMGPVWDFDLAFGSFNRYQEGDWATIGEKDGYVGITWMNYLKNDENFMNCFRTRWNDVKTSLLEKTLSMIDSMAVLIAPSAQMNFEIWDILGKSVVSQPDEHRKYNTYELQIQRLKTFIESRYSWLDKELGN